MAGMLDNFYNRRQRGEITLQTLLLLFAGTLLTLTLVVSGERGAGCVLQ